MHRPLSPSSTSSGGAAHTAERSQPRITRTQVVESAAHDSGVRTNLYLRVSLPVNQTVFPQAHHLLTLTPLSHLLHHSTYSLPLRFSLGSSSTDAIEAARKLNVPLLDDSSGVDPGAATVGRAEGRRGGGVFPHSTSGEPQAEVRLKQDDKDVQLWLDPAPPSVRSRSPTSDASALIPAGTRRRADSAAASTGEDRVEWIVVLRVETTFGGLQGPRFANTIALPLPPCLRNTLSFTLPPVAITSPWDLSVRPQLRMRPSPTGPNPDGSPDRTIHGSFTSTPLLQLVWTPRAVSDAPLVLARTSLEIHWSIGESGYGRADVRVRGEVEQYAGLREKATVELAVVVGPSAEDAGRMWDVLKVEGDVLNWEVDTGARTQPESKRKNAKPADDSTPVRRARPPKPASTPLSQRPPSFTSLFDTPEPVAPKLDPATLQRMKAPSLLGTEAPFEEGASLDMTFELESESSENPLTLVSSASSAAESSTSTDTDTPERPTSALSQASDAAPVLVRIQLPMSQILTPTTLPSPSFSFSASFSFPSVTLLALHSAFAPSPATSTPFRLSLPTFSLPASKAEDTVVTVSAGIGGSVELLGAAPLAGDDDSPLPALGGKARWRTERTSPEPVAARRHGRNKSECVEVEVKLPAARPTSVVLIDPMPSPPLSPSPLSPWNNTLSSKPSLLSLAPPSPVASSRRSRASSLSATMLPPFKTRLTPVAPLAAHLPWRIFAHVTFAHPFTGSFDLPLRDGAGAEGQTVEVCAAWDGDGQGVELPSEYFDVKGEARRVRAGPCEDGVKEVQYVVGEMAGDDGQVRVGDVLPRIGQRVAEMQVEVLDATGYQLHTSSHTFDTATPNGSSTTFNKFLLAPSSTSRLGAVLRPALRNSTIIPAAAPPLGPTKSKPPPPLPAKAKSKAKDELQGSDWSGAPKIMVVLMLLCILAPVVLIFLPSFLPSDVATDAHAADEIQQILSNVMRGPPPTIDRFAPTSLPITTTALALAPTPTPIPTLAPPPPPPEEIRGKEIEAPFDAGAFDWSFGAWRAVPIQLGLRGREIVVGLFRWLGLM